MVRPESREHPRVAAVHSMAATPTVAGPGACGCLVLVATLPWPALAAGVAVSAAGVVYRSVRLRGSRP